MENNSPRLTTRFNSFVRQCFRVWQILKKPTGEEFSTVAKISAIGLLLVGVLGFIIAMAMNLAGIA